MMMLNFCNLNARNKRQDCPSLVQLFVIFTTETRSNERIVSVQVHLPSSSYYTQRGIGRCEKERQRIHVNELLTADLNFKSGTQIFKTLNKTSAGLFHFSSAIKRHKPSVFYLSTKFSLKCCHSHFV